MVHRLLVKLIFPKSSGMATWCRDQMQVRHNQAVDINANKDNAEPKFNTVNDHDANNQVFRCNLPLLDEAHAIDAYNTLTDASIWAWLANNVGLHYVEHHTCDHDEVNRAGCVVQSRKEHGEDLIP